MAREEEEPNKRGFKVQDRRRFSASGDTLDAGAEPPGGHASPSSAAAAAAPEPAQARTGGAEAGMSFSTFVLSLSTQALAHLGEIPDPIDNTTRVDLVAARHFIDILAMLQEKTAGNLDRSEAEILEHALYDLRMRFVDHSQRR